MADKLKAAPDPAQYMPVAAVQQIMAERKEAAAGRAQGKVDTAFRQGYIRGGMRDWASTLCQTDDPAIDAFLARTGPTYGHPLKKSVTSGPFKGHASEPVQSQTEAMLCAQLRRWRFMFKPRALKLRSCSCFASAARNFIRPRTQRARTWPKPSWALTRPRPLPRTRP